MHNRQRGVDSESIRTKTKGDKMKKIKLLLAILASMTLGLQQASATAPDVNVMYKPGVGHYLTDAQGRTLYWSKHDMPSMSSVTGSLLDKWPPFYQGAILSAAPDMAATDFGTILRKDGKMQNTFRGYPLYYFSSDRQPGDTNGHKFNKIWSVMFPGRFHLVEKYYTGFSKTVGSID